MNTHTLLFDEGIMKKKKKHQKMIMELKKILEKRRSFIDHT
jgi:hypothetical protein